MIHDQMRNLFTMFQRAHEPNPVDIFEEMTSLPDPGVLPMPWTSWLLIVLIRHREKQIALKQMIYHEAPELFDCDSDDSIYINSWHIQPAYGFAYFIMKNGRTGEELLINKLDSDHYICKGYEIGEVSVWSPEHRLSCLCDKYHSAHLQAYVDLEATEILQKESIGREPEPFCESDFVVLSQYILERTGAMQTFIHRWDEPENRLWLSCLLGDWDVAHEMAKMQQQHRIADACARNAALLDEIWECQQPTFNWWHRHSQLLNQWDGQSQNQGYNGKLALAKQLLPHFLEEISQRELKDNLDDF